MHRVYMTNTATAEYLLTTITDLSVKTYPRTRFLKRSGYYLFRKKGQTISTQIHYPLIFNEI